MLRLILATISIILTIPCVEPFALPIHVKCANGSSCLNLASLSLSDQTTTQDDTNYSEEATSLLVSHSSRQDAVSNKNKELQVSPGVTASQYWNTVAVDEIQALANAVSMLALQAKIERGSPAIKSKDGFSFGRVMLGICASNTAEGIQTLKEWVAELQLPKGLLHGMDIDGVPVEIQGAVYIKYSTGGAMTFSEMRRSKRGFDALWKPGDANMEPYDGDYRGVYFSVELQDEVFRNYGVLPSNLLHRPS